MDSQGKIALILALVVPWVNLTSGAAPVVNGNLSATIAASDDDTFIVPQYTFTDPDGDPLHYSLSETSTTLSVNPTTGLLESRIEMEVGNMDEFVLIVSDGKETPTTVTVTVTAFPDQNDPVLSGSLEAYVTEGGVSPKTITTHFTITDADVDDRIVYFLDDENFSMGPFDSTLKTKNTLDYEKKSTYHPTLVYSDSKKVMHTATLTVKVVNVDEAPVCEQTTIKTSVDPLAVIGSLVSVINCKDPEGSVLTYTIKSGNVGNLLGLDLKSGRLTLNEDLSKGEYKSLKIEVEVTDTTGHTTPVTVNTDFEKGGSGDGNIMSLALVCLYAALVVIFLLL